MLLPVGETSGKGWDDQRAWSITEKFEAYYREHVPAGWRASAEEDSTIDTLIRRRSLAGELHDMREWEKVHHKLLTLCIASWKRFEEERAPKPTSKNKPSKKKSGVN